MADITMPQLGETVTEGTITRWLKRVGDRVEEDEVLYEVSTDKVDSEVPSPVSGYLAEILVEEGETVDVGAKLAVISDQRPGEDDGGDGEAQERGAGGDAQHNGSAPSTARSAGADGAEQKAGDRSPEAAPGAGGKAEAASAADGSAGDESAGDESAGDDSAGDESAGDGSAGDESAGDAQPGDSGQGTAAPDRVAPVADAPPGAGTRPADTRPGRRDDGAGRILSPVVRRLVVEHQLDPSQITGTGAGGRITRADVLALIDRGAGARPAGDRPSEPEAPREAAAAAPTEPPGGGPSQGREPAPVAGARREARVSPGQRDEIVAFSNIRRRTAEHMVRSLATSAHTCVAIEVDYENVERVRRAEKDRFRAQEGFGLSYLPFIARALVDAIEEFPHVNASLGDDSLIVHRYVNLGIAVDLNYEGLIVPVIHDAETKRMRALAREISDLATRARSKRLGADEIAGGTFTITNAGGYGTLLTVPIINQPQVAILSTDGVKPQPVAVPLPGGGHGVAVHSVGNLAVSFDHRAYDGAYAAAFLARIKEILETRDWSQEL